jgi:hypothetical protein
MRCSSAYLGFRRGAHNKPATYRCDLPVPGRATRRHLLHAGNFAARRGGLGRRSSSRAFWDWSDCPRQRGGVVARADLLDSFFSDAVLPRARHLGYANLPRHLAGGAPVRVAWAGGVHWRRGDHRPAAGLPDRGDVPEVDGVRTWRCTHPRRRRDLCRYRGHRARRDAPRRGSVTYGQVTQQILITAGQ